jgi:acetyltransferase
MPDLNALLWPNTVAVIGASPDPHIIRGRIMNMLGCHPFPGTIYPISRSHDEINGLKTYKSVADVPEKVDLAIMVIPAANVPDALEECGANGVRGAMIISSGFAEETGETGDALQDRIREIALRYDMAISGPNSEGFSNLLAPLCATFSPTMDDPGTPLVTEARDSGFIGVTGQSGGIGYSFYDRGRPKELPFSYVVTTGNEACLSGIDFVDFMLDDGRTEVFVMFMEDVKDPAKFREVAEKALRAGKPIIVTKIGRSDAGKRAAQSHTAALTGSHAAYEAMFRRYGIIEGRDSEEIVDIASRISATSFRWASASASSPGRAAAAAGWRIPAAPPGWKCPNSTRRRGPQSTSTCPPSAPRRTRWTARRRRSARSATARWRAWWKNRRSSIR